MVNPCTAQGSDAQSIGAPAFNTNPPHTHATNDTVHPSICNINTFTSADYQTSDNPLALTEHTDEQNYLTSHQRHGPIPNPWRDALRQSGITTAERLFVRADGSCAGGSFMLGLADETLGCVPITDARSPLSIRDFRTNDLTGRVRAWTVDQWCELVPDTLREEIKDYRPPCSCVRGGGNVCTCTCGLPLQPADERDIFISLCERPNYAVGPVFFYIASIVMQVGVLLLINDYRYGTHLNRQAHDFGTSQYKHSMIIYGSYPSPKSNQSNGVGHFETVGLSKHDGRRHQTLFLSNHPMLTALRRIAELRSDPKTLDHSRINYLPHPAQLLNAQPSPMTLQSSITPVATAAGTPATVATDGRHGRRRTPSEKVRAAFEQDQKRVRRSLSKQLDGSDSQNSKIADPSPVRLTTRSKSTPTVWSKDAGPATVPDVLDTPSPPPTRQDTISAQIQANVRNWIRRTSAQGQLAPKIHYSAIPLWTLRCRGVLQALAASLRSEPMDTRAVIAHLCILWMLPGEIFTTPSRSGAGAARRRNRYNRIHHKLNDDGLIQRMMNEVTKELDTPGNEPDSEHDAWVSLISSPNSRHDDRITTPAADTTADDLATGARQNKTQRDNDRKCVQRVQRLFEQGHSYRAMQALTSDTDMADLNLPDERAKLRTLHPSAQQPMHQCPLDAPELVVDWNWMEAEMRASDNGAAAGPSGYGSNYLSVLAADPHCVHALAFFIQQIVNNKLPEVIQTLLTTCIVVSLVKDNDGGRRPIAIGDIFYRMAARYSLSLVIDKAQQKLEPHQYGAGKPDGCTQIVQSIQHLLKDKTPQAPTANDQSNSTARPMACLSIDISNAFNAIDRATVLRTVYSDHRLSQCWRTLAFGYGRPSLLLMQCDNTVPDSEAFLESQTGVRQGDPLAALVFSLAMHTVYDTLAKVVSAGCYAFVDDGHFVGTIDECWKVWEMLPSLLRPLGLSVNPAKCEFTCFYMNQTHDTLDREALGRFQTSPLKLNDHSLKLLGCVVGVDNATIAAELKNNSTELRADQITAFRRIPLLNKQTGMLALQHLSGTVITNRLRAMPPAATLQHAKKYDAAVIKTAHTIIGITDEDGDRYDQEIQAPLSMGGFGLTSAVSIAPAAYIAGAENTLKHSPAFTQIWSGTHELPTDCDMFNAINFSIRRITSIASPLIARSDPKYVTNHTTDLSSLLPESATSFVSYFKTKPPCLIQSSITHRIATLSFIARVSEAARAGSAGKETVARLRSLKAAGSSLWLQTLPTESALTLTDKKWQWAARLRLGMPVPCIETDCRGCKQTDAYIHNQWHSLACTHLSGRPMTDRHNMIVNILARFCSLMQVNARTEPAQLDHDSNKRPDIQVSLPDITLLGDVTITHPATKTWKRITSKHGVQAVGDHREAEKNKKYSDLAKAADMKFLPIVLYTYGGFHRSALRFINALTDALDPTACLLSRAQFKQTLKQHIAIAVQRGTAEIMIQDDIRQRDMVMGSRSSHRYLISKQLRTSMRSKSMIGTRTNTTSHSNNDSTNHVENTDDQTEETVMETATGIETQTAVAVVESATSSRMETAILSPEHVVRMDDEPIDVSSVTVHEEKEKNRQTSTDSINNDSHTNHVSESTIIVEPTTTINTNTNTNIHCTYLFRIDEEISAEMRRNEEIGRNRQIGAEWRDDSHSERDDSSSSSSVECSGMMLH